MALGMIVKKSIIISAKKDHKQGLNKSISEISYLSPHIDAVVRPNRQKFCSAMKLARIGYKNILSAAEQFYSLAA